MMLFYWQRKSQLLQNISKELEIEVTHACKLNLIVLGMSEFIRFEMF